MNSIRTYTRHALFLLLSLVAASCTAIDWVDPYYKEAAGITDPVTTAPASQYTITFDANGGTGTMSNLTVTEGASVSLTTNTYTMAGHAFLGWATSSGATIAAYNDGASYTMGNNNMTFYAVWQSTTWTHQAYLKASNAEAVSGDGEAFGFDVSISGDTIVVGAQFERSNETAVSNSGSLPTPGDDNDSAPRAGAAYVFVRSGTTWSQQAYLKAPNASDNDYFGISVSISGDTIVVGARLEDSNQTIVQNSTAGTPDYGTDDGTADDSGAAYVFVRSGTSWSHQAYLKAPNAGNSDQFGRYKTIISGNTIVVGAWSEDSSQTTITNNITVFSSYGTDDGTADDSGAAYVFVRSGTSWSQQAYLKAPNVGFNDRFGYSASVSNDTIVVGAVFEDSNQTMVQNSTAGTPDYGVDDGNANDSGAAYVFVRSGTAWSQQAYLKASNAGADDYFGPVSVFADTIVVGAYYEDSNQTMVANSGSLPTAANDNDDASQAGAAYVFTRSGTSWSQQAYLKAPNAGTADEFGRAVAISGNTIVVGAPFEDSNQTMVQNSTAGTPDYGTDDGNADDSGAAYVFMLSGTTWSQQAYLKAPNAGANDLFGHRVSISGDTIVVGARWEDSSETSVINGTMIGADPGTATDSGAAYVFVR